MNLDYAGDLSPSQTWDKIKENRDCFLVDCRTSAEWSWVGVPDLDSIGKKVVFISDDPASPIDFTHFSENEGYKILIKSTAKGMHYFTMYKIET